MSQSFDEFTDDLDILIDDYENGETSRESLMRGIIRDVGELVEQKTDEVIEEVYHE